MLAVTSSHLGRPASNVVDNRRVDAEAGWLVRGRMTRSVVGREAELARIEAFLEPGSTAPRVALIEGHLGMGKTTLWSAAIEHALDRSWRVLQTRPTDAEATFAYAGLGDILESVPDEALAVLPIPQRKALRVALLREEPEGPIHDSRAVAVACLNTLRSLSADGHVVIAVDDIQWLDPASAQAIAFVIRRLDGDSIRFLLARRLDDPTPLLGLDRAANSLAHERIEVGPIGPETMGRLLADRLGHPFSGATLRKIQASSAGNPLFAIELGRAMRMASPSEISGGDVPIPQTLLDLVGAPIGALPDASQRALAVVAALAAPTVALVSDAIGAPAEGLLRPAVDAHLVVIEGDRIRFAHPLHAVAARSSLTPAAQREIHARLAEIVPDPEERARHLALATIRPGRVDRSCARGGRQADASTWRTGRGSRAGGHVTPTHAAGTDGRRDAAGPRGGLGTHDGRRLRASP